MTLDLSKVLSSVGDEAIARAGDQVGLDRDQSIRVVKALSARMGAGREAAIAGAAEEAGLGQEVVAALMGKVTEIAAEKALSEGPIGDALGQFKAPAAEAASGLLGDGVAKQAGGFMSKMFGRK